MRERRQATTQETHDKDDEARRSDCLVDGLHLWIVEALANALGAHDDAAQVAQALDVLERLDDLLGRDAGDERERAERKQALLRLCRVRRRRGSLFRTVRLAVLLHVVVEHSGRVDGLGGLEEVEPRVGERHDRDVDPVRVHELDLLGAVPVLRSDGPALAVGALSLFLLEEHDHLFALGVLDDLGDLLPSPHQVHV